jgi:hypothetical protein
LARSNYKPAYERMRQRLIEETKRTLALMRELEQAETREQERFEAMEAERDEARAERDQAVAAMREIQRKYVRTDKA